MGHNIYPTTATSIVHTLIGKVTKIIYYLRNSTWMLAKTFWTVQEFRNLQFQSPRWIIFSFDYKLKIILNEASNPARKRPRASYGPLS